jgi:hypothetical protein
MAESPQLRIANHIDHASHEFGLFEDEFGQLWGKKCLCGWGDLV